jgi:hypothetical protein
MLGEQRKNVDNPEYLGPISAELQNITTKIWIGG